jgi:hypothetical protein
MPKEIFPSSFECDCGHQSDFFENTVRDMKAMSQKKKVYLADSAPEEHTIVFYRGQDGRDTMPETSAEPPDQEKSSPEHTSYETRRHTRDTRRSQDGRRSQSGTF